METSKDYVEVLTKTLEFLDKLDDYFRLCCCMGNNVCEYCEISSNVKELLQQTKEEKAKCI